MSHHNKYYSVYSTGSGYKYEVTESFDDGDFVSISKELSEPDLKSKCYPLLGAIYDSIALNKARAVDELYTSGISDTYDTWASSSFIDKYAGSYTVDESGSAYTHSMVVSLNSDVSYQGLPNGSIEILSDRMFNYVSGSSIAMYSDDGIHYKSENGLLNWNKE
jgi:hypothetical protein